MPCAFPAGPGRPKAPFPRRLAPAPPRPQQWGRIFRINKTGIGIRGADGTRTAAQCPPGATRRRRRRPRREGRGIPPSRRRRLTSPFPASPRPVCPPRPSTKCMWSGFGVSPPPGLAAAAPPGLTARSRRSDSHLTQIIRLWPDTNLLEQWVLLRSA